MSAYEDDSAFDSPTMYYRLDMVGPSLDGDVVPDISGNDLDAELSKAGDIGSPDPVFDVYGHPSPIETDAASRAAWLWANTSPSSEIITHAYISRDSDPLMEPDDGKEFACEAWIKPRTTMFGATQTKIVYKEGTGGILYEHDGDAVRIGAFCHDSMGTLFRYLDTVTAYDLGNPESTPFAYVVAQRVSDAIVLYVNGELRGFASVTSALPTGFTAGKFFISPQQLTVISHQIDEVRWLTHSLTANRIRTRYETALNVLNMRGEANLRTSAVLNGADEPDPAAYSFRHNWSEPVIERFRWRTGVFKPTDGPTGLRRQRSGLRRQVEYQHLLYNENLRRQFEARAFGGRTTLVQFEPDKVRVGSLPANATSATFDTTLKDFEVGHRVLIYQDDDTYEFHTLIAVTDTGVEWDEGLSQNYTNPWIKPARVARLPTTTEVELHTDTVGENSTIYEYQSEDEPFVPRRITAFTPTLTYHSREVFDLAEWQGHDYSELPTIEYVTDRSEVDEGTGTVAAKQYRWGAEVAQSYNMNLEGRDLIAKYLGWLYHRAGQYQPFWMPTFRQDLKPLSRSGDDLTVEGHEYSTYYVNADNRFDLAFVYFDNTVQLRRIESVTPSGANDVLTLDSSVPTLTNLRWLSFLRRVVLSSDDVEIAWQTDNVARVAFAVVDAPLDIELGSPSVSPSPSASTSISISPSSSVSLSLSPSASQSPSSSASPTPSASTSPSSSGSSSISPSPSLSPSSSSSPST